MKKAKKKVVRKLSAAGFAVMAGAAHGQSVVQSAGANATPAPSAAAPAEKLPSPQVLSMRLRMRMNLIDNAWNGMSRAQFDEHYGAAQEILSKLKAQRMSTQQQQYALMTELRLRELDSQFEKMHR